MGLVFDRVNSVKQIVLPYVGGHQQYVKDLNRTKRQRKGNCLPFSLTPSAGTQVFS